MTKEYKYSIQALRELYQFRGEIGLIDCLLAIAERMEAHVEATKEQTRAIDRLSQAVKAISQSKQSYSIITGQTPDYGPCGGE